MRSDRFDSLLRWNDLVVTSNHDDGAESPRLGSIERHDVRLATIYWTTEARLI